MAELRDRLQAALDASTTPAMSVAGVSPAVPPFAFELGDVPSAPLRFQAASISKTVAAEVVLALVADGLVGLDDDVFDRIPEARAVVGRAWQPSITVRMVLAHRAGFVDDAGFPGYPMGAPLPSTIDTVVGGAHVTSAPVRVGILPGSQFRYSGGGYQVLQLLVERVTGAPYTATARRLVLDPAGMDTATFDTPAAGTPGFAIAHVDGVPVEGGWRVYPEHAAASMWCTATDLLALHRRVTARPAEWLRDEASTWMGDYGLGVVIGHDGATVSHNGGNLGFTCSMIGGPDGRHRVAVMTNGQDGVLVERCVALVAEELGWDAIPPPDPKQPTQQDLVAGVVGAYEGDGHRAVIDVDPSHGVRLAFDDQPPMPLSFQPPDLTAPGMALTIRIRTENGTRLLDLRQPGLQLRLVRRDGSPACAPEPRAPSTTRRMR